MPERSRFSTSVRERAVRLVRDHAKDQAPQCSALWKTRDPRYQPAR